MASVDETTAALDKVTCEIMEMNDLLDRLLQTLLDVEMGAFRVHWIAGMVEE